MVTFYCTHKLLGELRVKPEEGGGASETLLGDWYVNSTRFGRYKGYLFVNERTLYSFVIVERGINARTILGAFRRMLGLCLSSEGFDQATVGRALADCDAALFAKATNRKVLGNMNDLKFHYDWEIDGPVPEGSCAHLLAAQRLNRMPQRNIGWKFSIDLMQEILANAGSKPAQ